MTAAGGHARGSARRLARRGLTGLLAGFTSTVFVVGEIAVIAGLLWLDRRTIPAMERWRRGASGEEHVGRILDGLASNGWLAIHDVNTGRGNIARPRTCVASWPTLPLDRPESGRVLEKAGFAMVREMD